MRAYVVWTRQVSPSLLRITEVGYGNGVFVALANSGQGPWTASEILTSTDGRQWTSDIGSIKLRGVAFGNDNFVAVGDRGTILNSSDGKAWRPGLSPTKATLSDVTFAQGTFVA